MKTLQTTMVFAGFLFLLCSCHDFVERQPTNEQLTGKWEVDWLVPTVRDWLKNNEINELPEGAGIELRADGTFVATSLPYVYERKNSVDRCLIINQGGTWKLTDSRTGHSLVKWQIEIQPEDLKVICRMNLHQDAGGLYLDNPIDWESPKSVTLRKPKSNEH